MTISLLTKLVTSSRLDKGIPVLLRFAARRGLYWLQFELQSVQQSGLASLELWRSGLDGYMLEQTVVVSV